MCIIPQIYIIQNYGIFNYAIISNINIFKQDRILNHSVYNTSTGNQRILNICARIVFSRWKIINLGLNCRLLFEEVVTDLRFQEAAAEEEAAV
jgi:hypothetical protein